MKWIRAGLIVAAMLALSSCEAIAMLVYRIGDDIHRLHAYTIGGHVSDENSVPLTTATVAINDKPPQPLKAPYFSLTQLGGAVEFTFAAPGHYPRTYKYQDDGLFEIMPDGPSFPVELLVAVKGPPTQLHVVLDKIENPSHLLNFEASLRLSVGPGSAARSIYFDIDRPDSHESSAPSDRTTVVGASPAFPPNAFYITSQADSTNPDIFASTFQKGDYIPCPTLIRLVSSSSDGGIQLIPFEDGHYVQGRPRTAPETGYQNQITLTDAALRQLGKTHCMPFFFKAGKVFGRGVITDFYAQGSYRDHTANELTLYVTFHIQPDGTRNVE